YRAIEVGGGEVVVLFFFQAEDGIRDKLVTGVQTCALPISADQAAVDAMRQALNSLSIDGTVVIGEGERDEAPMLYIGETVGTGRSEERRVGKECRSRWARDR